MPEYAKHQPDFDILSPAPQTEGEIGTLSKESLQAATGEILEQLRNKVYEILVTVPDSETFDAIVGDLYKLHKKTVTALTAIIQLNADPEEMRALRKSILKRTTDILLATSPPWIPEEARGEIEFCLETYNRATILARKFASIQFDDEQRQEQDWKLCKSFHEHCFMFGFATGGVVYSIAEGKAISPQVLVEILSIQRQGALGCYQDAREAYDLRFARDEDEDLPISDLDEEDELLANLVSPISE
jgi:hypothetical protein